MGNSQTKPHVVVLTQNAPYIPLTRRPLANVRVESESAGEHEIDAEGKDLDECRTNLKRGLVEIQAWGGIGVRYIPISQVLWKCHATAIIVEGKPFIHTTKGVGK